MNKQQIVDALKALHPSREKAVWAQKSVRVNALGVIRRHVALEPGEETLLRSLCRRLSDETLAHSTPAETLATQAADEFVEKILVRLR